jgi:endonuclease G
VSVIGGPIFSDTDPVYRGVRVPKRFWKVIYYREAGDESVKAKGYVLTQDDLLNRIEALELPEFAVYEVPIPRIADMTGLGLSPASAPEAIGRRGRRRETLVEDGQVRRIASVREILG